MDSTQFDTLVKSFSSTDTRRALLRRLAPLPLAGLLTTLLPGESEAGGRHKRRTTRNKRQSGDDKENRKGKRTGKRSCANAGQTPKTGKRTGCCTGLSKDATGRCAAAGPAANPAAGPAPAACTGLKPTNISPTQGLQEAINAAGDTLTLCAGTWRLSQTVDIAKDLTLIGAGAGQTILDGGGPGGVTVVHMVHGTVTLRDLTITNGDAADFIGGGILQDFGSLTLIGVSVTDSIAKVGGGICNSQGRLTLGAGSRVTDNNTTNYGGGGGIANGGNLVLKAGSLVTRNTADGSASFGGGVFNEEPFGTATVEPDAFVCGNFSANGPDDCVGMFTGNCPQSPPSGICPA